MYWNLIWKGLGFVPFSANLTQIRPKPDLAGLSTGHGRVRGDLEDFQLAGVDPVSSHQRPWPWTPDCEWPSPQEREWHWSKACCCYILPAYFLLSRQELRLEWRHSKPVFVQVKYPIILYWVVKCCEISHNFAMSCQVWCFWFRNIQSGTNENHSEPE